MIPPPPTRIGMNPQTSDDVNLQTGQMLRDFVVLKERIGHCQAWLAGVDLKESPYNMTAELETLIKSAVFGLDTSLDAVDMTFINRMVGIW